MFKLPGGCWICRDWQGDALCAACLERFAAPRPRCPRCALLQRGPHCAACLRDPLPLDEVHAALSYEPPWDGLLQRWKYEAALGLGKPLAALLASRLPAPPAEALLLPVPLHPARLGERGYHQSLLLAQALAGALQLRLRPDALLRVLDTPHQARLSRRERLANLRQAFASAPGLHLEGAHCVLVDDVMTTGATLATLAALLRRAGAARVDAWVLARTEPEDSPSD